MKMKAIVVTEYGGPEVLRLQEVERPEPGPGHALVRLAAIGINYMDVYQRTGFGRYRGQLPLIPGAEGAGTVESIGQGVTAVRPGDRVAYTGVPRSYAEYVAAPADRLIPLPDDISFEQGSAFPLQGMTAHYLVHEFYHVRPGTSVLVHAVAGGVGLLLTQMLRNLGARVIGTTSSEQKADIAREAGAQDVILYTKGNFVDRVRELTNDKGADFILDGVGKSTFPGDLEAARRRGTIVVFGSSSGAADPISPNTFAARSLMVGGGTLPDFIATRVELERRANDIMRDIREGRLKLRIDRTFPLEQAAEAHRLLESRQTVGKLLLIT
jgi:NADPH2:quinone reductase